MSWSLSFLVAFLTGVLGLFVSGLVTAALNTWLNVSTREGADSYLMIAMAIIGGFVGFLLGLTVSRVVAGMTEPGFLKALGISGGVVLALGGLALLVGWLSADFAPKLDGKNLELALEVRCPKGFTLPKELDEYGAYAAVRIPGSRRYQPQGKLDLAHPRSEDGRMIVTARVPLQTSSANKVMTVRFSKETDLIFWLPQRRHPNRGDLEWSPWVDSGWAVGTPEPPKEKRFNLRYKALIVEPPPPEPSPADARAKEFAALPPDAPLEQWLPFLFEEPNAERTKVVIEHINAQQGDLARLLRSKDGPMREWAFAAVKYAEQPAPEVKGAVLAEGRDIAEGIRRANALAAEDPQFIDALLDLRTRFNHWKDAWWLLSKRLGVDGRPPVQEIYDLATARARGTAMDEIADNARAILDAFRQPAAEKKP
ncbi:MAG: hypothetical protein IT578_10530 [Verrucomicrobiae bacterium]|nr:hypothetical protein [Verrucomicrobiae bacterium]